MAARRATAGRPYEERGGILDEDRISLRQLITLTFAALLSPAIRVFPGRTAQLAGEGGWLAALAALPLALGLCWALSALLKGMRVEEAVARMEGIRCGGKPTSCPDQLARALKQAL